MVVIVVLIVVVVVCSPVAVIGRRVLVCVHMSIAGGVILGHIPDIDSAVLISAKQPAVIDGII